MFFGYTVYALVYFIWSGMMAVDILFQESHRCRGWASSVWFSYAERSLQEAVGGH
jgi:hypothetical protein